MERSEALLLLKKYVRNEKMIIHSIESEAVMRALAKKLGENEDKWALAGLLHDIDVELTNADPKIHGLQSVEILQKNGIDEEIIDAIMMHNEIATGKQRHTKFQHALAAGETITGLIHATTLVYPEKKIANVKTSSVVKRMKEKLFAASVNREHILECELVGINLNEFAELSINAMKEISNEIGL
ncbi:MAG: HDIG domain-containing protein [Bacteroidales bacterium]|nr:HDIG domain-containing protein [Bacteroidales bacterium]HQP04229.1 HDIG domain-containing protein [Bacteroidales bacterium]